MDARKKEKEKENARIMRDFGHRLEKLIYEKFDSKKEFLGEVEFDKKGLHAITTGKADPQLTTLHRFAKALGMTPSQLLGDEEK